MSTKQCQHLFFAATVALMLFALGARQESASGTFSIKIGNTFFDGGNDDPHFRDSPDGLFFRNGDAFNVTDKKGQTVTIKPISIKNPAVAADSFTVEKHSVMGVKLTNLLITADTKLTNFEMNGGGFVTYDDKLVFGGTKLGHDEVAYGGATVGDTFTIQAKGFIDLTPVGTVKQVALVTQAPKGTQEYQPNPSTGGNEIALPKGKYFDTVDLTIVNLPVGDTITLFDSGNAGASVVPEPTSLVPLGTGLALFGAAAWRRRKRAASPQAYL